MFAAKVVTHSQSRITACINTKLNSVLPKSLPGSLPRLLPNLRWFFKAAFCAIVMNTLVAAQSHAADGKKVTLTGEMIDTWCYVSQIMGSSEVVVGTAHHVCAVWCAAGGIPVGLLDSTDDTVYMILSFEGDDASVANEKLLYLQSHELTVKGTAFELDGLNYLNIDEVITDNGIVNLTHEKFGIIPGEARP